MHIALRSQQVQGVDGNTRQVKPGDEIPEADTWPTRQAYINRGWIAEEGQPLNDAATARMGRAIKDRDKEISELQEEVRGLRASAPVTIVNNVNLETPATHELSEGSGLTSDAPSEDPKLTKKELQKMGKESLMTLAESAGIDPGQGRNKLVEAIFAAQ